MPIHYEQDDTTRRVIMTVEGLLTLDDLTAAANRQAAAGAWSYGVLLDARGRVGEPTSTTTVRGWVDHNLMLTSEYGPPGPFAIVPRDPVGFGMARMFEILSDTSTTGDITVCRSMEKAHAWLDDRPWRPAALART